MRRATDDSNERKTLDTLRRRVSIGALVLVVLHLLWPALAIDAITLVLVVVAVLPWLAPLIKSFELPGGWKIEFRDLQKAAARADSAGLLAPQSTVDRFSFELVAEHDPNLALAGLRIEIERRLVALAQASGVDRGRPMGIGQLLRALTEVDVLTEEQRSILADMTHMLNGAVHGADVDPRAASWAIDVGPKLLASLDERVEVASST